MRNPLALARRIARAPAEEWRVRARQAWYTARAASLARGGTGPLPRGGAAASLGIAPDAWQAWFTARDTDWFVDTARVARLRDAARHPDAPLADLLRCADEVVAGRMPLFGFDPVPFTGTRAEDWHRDPILGREAPRRFYGAVPYLDATIVGDHKFVWEPSRFAFAHWLGVAWRATGEARYAERFLALLHGWFDANPYPLGIHYASALEVAYRAYAWVWALALFRDALVDEPRAVERLVEGIWTACHHVEANLSTYFSPNTHLTGEAFALYACGAALPELREARTWRTHGEAILAAEATRQFHADGTHRELSSSYQLYSVDLYLHAVCIQREAGLDANAAVEACAARSARRLAALTPADGHLPAFNDCDGGRLVSWGERALDARPTLHAAAACFANLDAPPGPPRGVALLIAPSAEAPARSESMTPGALDSGLVVHADPRGDYALFRATPFGLPSHPHSHDAALGVLLSFGGDALLVDSGTGHYTQDRALRDRFRSAEGKNAPCVDGRGPSTPADWFAWADTTDAELLEYTPSADGFEALGTHRGFRDPAGGEVALSRRVAFRRGDALEIEDRWQSAEPIALEQGFTLAPGVEHDARDGSLRHPSGMVYAVACVDADGRSVPAQLTRIPYSNDYGHVGETARIAFRSTGRASGRLTTTFRARPPR